MLEITALYASLLGLMAIWLASRPGLMRGKTKISVGDGGNPELLLAMRRHANFAEWVPITLIVFALLEAQGGPRLALHIMGALLVVARLLHAQGLKLDSMTPIGRTLGSFTTAVLLAVASIWNLVLHFT